VYNKDTLRCRFQCVCLVKSSGSANDKNSFTFQHKIYSPVYAAGLRSFHAAVNFCLAQPLLALSDKSNAINYNLYFAIHHCEKSWKTILIRRDKM
jgi:hypothetical protein